MKKTLSSPAVAVFDGNTPPALAFTRALGKAGIDVHVYDSSPFACTRFSRHCTSFTQCPPIEAADLFLAWAKQHFTHTPPLWIAPTSDLVSFYATQYPECFPPQPLHAFASPSSVLDVLLKNRFHNVCTQAGFPTANTFFFTSKEEAFDHAATLPYPLVIKPTSHVGVGCVRGFVVHNPSEFRTHYAPYPVPEHTASLFETFPSLRWPLVQSYIPGALEGMYSISGLINPQGQVVSYTGSCKKLQWPPKLGVGTLFEEWHEETPIQEGLAFAAHTLKQGLFELELLFNTHTQQYTAIDLNPRGHGFMSFDIARGSNLPLLWYAQTSGETLSYNATSPTHTRWVHGVPYHIGNSIQLLKGPKRMSALGNCLQTLTQHTVDIVHDNHDPLPSIPHTLSMFKHPGGLIKPFFQNHV